MRPRRPQEAQNEPKEAQNEPQESLGSANPGKYRVFERPSVEKQLPEGQKVPYCHVL